MILDSLIGSGLFAAVFLANHLIRSVLYFSIDIEEDSLAADVAYGTEGAKALSLLRTLEAITVVIFWSLLPIALVILGMILPETARDFMGNYIRPSTLIVASIVGLCAYWAVFTIWRRQQAGKIYDALKGLFRPPK